MWLVTDQYRAVSTHCPCSSSQCHGTSSCAAAVIQDDSPIWLKPQLSSHLGQLQCSPTAEGAVTAPLARNAHPTEGQGFLPGLAKLTVIHRRDRAGGKQGTGPLLSTEHHQIGPGILPTQTQGYAQLLPQHTKESSTHWEGGKGISLQPAAKTLFTELCHQTYHYYMSLGNRSLQLGNSSGATGSAQ